MIAQVAGACVLALVSLAALGANVHYHDETLRRPAYSAARRAAHRKEAVMAAVAALAFIAAMIVVYL